MNFTGGGNQTRTTKVRCTAAWASGIHEELIYLSLFNIFLSITAVLGNILILVALRKVSSLHSPSKLLFRCLATTDLCVGIITEPLVVVYWMSLTHGQWNLCRYVLVSRIIAGYNLSSVSLLTASAISVDRLLAPLLGLRYRQVVTLKRTYVIVVMFWFISTVASISYLLNRAITFWYFLMSCNVNRLVHKDFPKTPASSNSCTGPCPTRKTTPNQSTEYRAIQKSSVQCTVGALYISCLLFTIWYSDSFSKSF